jgi:glucose-6-phosphate 1-dehydrogenase
VLFRSDLEFRFNREFKGMMPDAYERLLLDVFQGDASLFARADEVELAWSIVDPIMKAWQQNSEPALEIYEPGLWGPTNSTEWMDRHGRQWFDTCPVLS